MGKKDDKGQEQIRGVAEATLNLTCPPWNPFRVRVLRPERSGERASLGATARPQGRAAPGPRLPGATAGLSRGEQEERDSAASGLRLKGTESG